MSTARRSRSEVSAHPGGVESDGTPDASHRLLRSSVEAILFVADAPVTAPDLARAVDAGVPLVEQVLGELAEEYARDERGFRLRPVGGGWRVYTDERLADVVERFVLDGQQTRLTQAALETLAIVAYRQPVSRSRVAAIRGVGVDGVFRTLLARGLIEPTGTDPDGGAQLYRTTPLFLEKLGLSSLDDLPALAPLLPHPDDITNESTSTSR